MKFPVVWLMEVYSDLTEAIARYEAIRPELGARFAKAVAETIEAVAVAPLRFSVVDKGRRRAGVRRFPYGIVFILENTRILVIACFHGKRNPKSWEAR